MKKKLFSLLMIFPLCMAASPHASAASSYEIYLGDKDESGPGWTWDASEHQLSFNGANIHADAGGIDINASVPEVDLVLHGDNTIMAAYDQITFPGKLNIQGEGTLNLIANTSSPFHTGGPLWEMAALSVTGDIDLNFNQNGATSTILPNSVTFDSASVNLNLINAPTELALGCGNQFVVQNSGVRVTGIPAASSPYQVRDLRISQVSVVNSSLDLALPIMAQSILIDNSNVWTGGLRAQTSYTEGMIDTSSFSYNAQINGYEQLTSDLGSLSSIVLRNVSTSVQAMRVCLPESGVYSERVPFELLKTFEATANNSSIVPALPNSTTATVDPTITAVPTTSKVLVDGKQVAFEAYNIQDNNYFKLRDIAQALKGSSKQFDVTWDGSKNAITLVTGHPYTTVGGELALGDGSSKKAVFSSPVIYIDGATWGMSAYNINDNNYFKLRELGAALDFQVSWDAATQSVIIDTSSSYSD